MKKKSHEAWVIPPDFKKVFLRMKLLFLLLFLCCISAVASSQKVSLNVKNSSLDIVLKEIMEQTDARILYNTAMAEGIRYEGLTFNRAELTAVLDQLLKNTTLGYEVLNGVYVIRERTLAAPQESVVSGKVVDAEGIPIPGVTVRLRGTSLGVATDKDGQFRLRIPVQTGVLEFSFVGFQPRQVSFSEQTESLTVILREEIKELNDMVVTGYQTLSKERVTGSFATVSGEELNRYFNTDIAFALEGKIAGIQREGTHLWIRGRSTLNASTSPLYVIDGFPVEGEAPTVGFNEIRYNPPGVNPEDIESITVLKDAAAASIYGARAANGVIVITTRRAKQGKTQISASADFSVQGKPDFAKMDYMSASEYIDFQYKYFEKATNKSYMRGSYILSPTLDLMLQVYEGTITQAEADREIDKYRSDGTPIVDDFLKYIYRPTMNQRYRLSLSKAVDRSSIAASVTYTDNQGNVKNTENRSVDLNLRNTLELARWLDSELTANLRSAKSTKAGVPGSLGGVNTTPYTRLVDEAGNPIPMPFRSSRRDQLTLVQYPDDLQPLDYILQDELERNIATTKSLRTRIAVMFNLKATEWMRFSTGFQYESGRDEQTTFYNKESYDMRMLYNGFSYKEAVSGNVLHHIPYGDSYAVQNTHTDNFTWRNQLNLNYTTQDGKHAIVGLLGTETRESKGHSDFSRVFGYDDGVLGYMAINNKELTGFYGGLMSASLSSGSFYSRNDTKNRFVSFFGNMMYAFDNRYDVTASIRWDLSDLFGTNVKYQRKPLWSVGTAWTLTNEAFMQEVDWVNRLRLRATYGINGNIAKSVSPYLVADYSLNSITGQQYGNVQTPPNASLRWEKTQVTNIGLDFDVLNNRLGGSVQYYYRNSTDLLSIADIDPTFGFTSLMLNMGEMTNQGWELELRSTPVRSHDFTWTAGFTLGYNQNKRSKVNREPPGVSSMVGGFAAVEGKPYWAMYSYRFSRIDDKGETVLFNEKGEEVSLTNITSVDALEYSGTTFPRYTGAIHSALNYKGVELSLNFVYNAGHKMRKRLASPHIGGALGPDNLMYSGYANAWEKPGDELKSGVTPRITYAYDANTSYRNNHWQQNNSQVVSADYVKLRNVALNYRLPVEWLNRTSIKGLSLRVQADNLFFISANGEKLDPENGTTPQRSTYSFGVNVSF